MKRREFIAATAAVLVSPRPLLAGGPPRRVGYLDGALKNLPLFKVWQDSMRDHGWIEGVIRRGVRTPIGVLSD